ncbi:Transposable element Tc1 transposase, partial [Stegodyphus mimosarum]
MRLRQSLEGYLPKRRDDFVEDFLGETSLYTRYTWGKPRKRPCSQPVPVMQTSYPTTSVQLRYRSAAVCRDSKRFVMASKYHLEESVKWRIIGRLEAGQSIMETATCLNISRQTVSKLWKQFQNDGSVVRRPGQGRKRMTTASEDRYLALTARRNRKATARQLSSELAAATGTVASRQTIYRRLNEKGLYARKPRVCVLLSSQKKRDRFNWCKEHQNWTEHQWSHVLFTDESRFSLTGDSKRVYIWRESGTRNDPSNIVERDRFGSGGVMVMGWNNDRWTYAPTRVQQRICDRPDISG